MEGVTGSIRDIVVLSEGHCFICLEKVKEEVTGQEGGDGTTTPMTHSVRKLCQHLKLDIWNAVLNNDKDDKEEGAAVPPGSHQGHPDLAVELCQECVQRVGAFSEAYQKLEDAKLKVASILGGIHGKFLGAEESGRTEQFRKLVGDAKAKLNSGGGGVGGEAGGPVSKMEELRLQMTNKCVRKLRGVGVPHPVPSPTQSPVPEELPSDPGKSNMEEAADVVDSRAASSCEDGLVKYQLVGVYDVKLEPEESPGPDQVPEDDVDGGGNCGPNGYVAMETGIDDHLMGPGSSLSAAAKSYVEAAVATMTNLKETNCDHRPHDHSQQKNNSEMMKSLSNPDFPIAQVIEMVNVKLESEEQIPLPQAGADEAIPCNGFLGAGTEDMSHHNTADLSRSTSPMDMDSEMEVTGSSGYASDCTPAPLSQKINNDSSSSSMQNQSPPVDFDPFSPPSPPVISLPAGAGTHPDEGQLSYYEDDDDANMAINLLELSWDSGKSAKPNGSLEGVGNQHTPEVHNPHLTKTWIPPATPARLTADLDISCATCHLKLTLPLDGPNSHKCSGIAKSSMKGPLDGRLLLEGEVTPSSSAPVDSVSVPVPLPKRVFSRGDNIDHSTPSRIACSRNPVTSLFDCCCCLRGFGHSSGLYGHHRNVHLGERFICPWPGCEISFPWNCGYRRHYRSVHLGIRQAQPKRKKRKRTITLKASRDLTLT